MGRRGRDARFGAAPDRRTVSVVALDEPARQDRPRLVDTSYDLHNLTGVAALLIMGLLGATALGRVFFSYVEVPPALDLVPRATARLHTASGFPWPLKVIYALGSLAFVFQAISGALVWWRPTAKARG